MAQMLKEGSPFGMPQVLVVDDSKAIRASLSKVLQMVDVDILEAESGKDALDLLQTEVVQLIFTDIGMPIMDGFELLRRVKKNPKTQFIPVIIISGDGEEEIRFKALQLGAYDLVAKPFDLNDLIPKVQKFVG